MHRKPLCKYAVTRGVGGHKRATEGEEIRRAHRGHAGVDWKVSPRNLLMSCHHYDGTVLCRWKIALPMDGQVTAPDVL